METSAQIQGLLEREVKLVAKDPELHKTILEVRNRQLLAKDPNAKLLDEALVDKMMRHNVFTMNQFVDLTGFSFTGINNKTRYSVRGLNKEIYTDLDYCHPYPDKDGDGPKFIVRNEKSIAFLKSTLIK